MALFIQFIIKEKFIMKEQYNSTNRTVEFPVSSLL